MNNAGEMLWTESIATFYMDLNTDMISKDVKQQK
jgi:hypothetical protein